MTDPNQIPINFETSEYSQKRRRRRARADLRFKLYGQAAILFSLTMLVVLVTAIGFRSISAFTSHSLRMDLTLSEELILPKQGMSSGEIGSNVAGFYDIIKNNLYESFTAQTPPERKALRGLVTRLAVVPLANKIAQNPELIGTNLRTKIILSDDADLFFEQRKNVESSASTQDPISFLRLKGTEDGFAGVTDAFYVSDNTVTKYISLTGSNTWEAEWTIASAEGKISETPKLYWLNLGQDGRNFSDLQYAYLLALDGTGRVKKGFNLTFFTNVDSTYPELAGILAAFVGSLLTMIVTALMAIPVGVAASIYLEEFAQTSKFNNVIEVNINNLAAVPSILFGLLGAAFLIDSFGMPRSAPLVGGIVLGLLVLPTIIIASRTALRTVPNDLRAAALGIGASKMQTVTHHVLPLAVPGMLTGAILAMARALGETAPLILIGMVAFVAQVPTSTTDGATALPVLVYRWATLSERAWEPLTAAAIVILLAFLITMNLSAVLIRRYFEQKA